MKISVIIQSHNRPKGLKRLLACLEAQSVPVDLFEVVISDDSIDSLAIENAIDGTKMNVVYRHTAPCGAAESMQEALSRSSGEYIKIIHDDDLVSPFSLEDGMKILDSVKETNIVANPAIIRYPERDVLYCALYNEVKSIPSAVFAGFYESSPPGPFQSPVCAMYRRHPGFRAFWEYENADLREFARRTGAGTDVQLQVESALSNRTVVFIPRINSILCTDLNSTTQAIPEIGRYYAMWAEEYKRNPRWRYH